MGSAHPFCPEKLVIAVLLSDGSHLPALLACVQRVWGMVDSVRPPEPYTFTRYYEPEMGPSLIRTILGIAALQDPSRLASIKIATNRIEQTFAAEGRRRVNLDPGLLSRSRFVLASTKDSSHRVPLAEGIYAETTLVYEHGAYRPVEWTYPDWASPPYRAHLAELRAAYVAALRDPHAPEHEPPLSVS